MWGTNAIKILIIDNKPNEINDLLEILKRIKCEVIVIDSKDYKNYIKAVKPSLILMSIEIYCYDLTLKFGKYENIPFLFYGNPEYFVVNWRTFRFNGVDFIVRPFDASDLIKRINHYISLYLIINKLPIFGKLIHLNAESNIDRLDTIKKMIFDSSCENFHKIRSIIHTLKGSNRNIIHIFSSEFKDIISKIEANSNSLKSTQTSNNITRYPLFWKKDTNFIKRKQPKILVVDDEKNTRKKLKEAILLRLNCKVFEAINGLEAVKIAKKEIPDLIIMDISMPDMDGIAATEEIKSYDCLKYIPIIFLTQYNEFLINAFESGGVDFVMKPVKINDILCRIRVQLQLRNAYEELRENNYRLRKEIEKRKLAETKLETANKKLESLAHSDGLTKVANRRYFNIKLKKEWKRLSRDNSPVSIIMCDIDYFKRYNDTYGHPKGDECLELVAQSMKDVVKRPADIVARYGGNNSLYCFRILILKGRKMLQKKFNRMY